MADLPRDAAAAVARIRADLDKSAGPFPSVGPLGRGRWVALLRWIDKQTEVPR